MGSAKPALRLVPSRSIDHRNGKPVTCPLAANGILVANDRRTLIGGQQPELHHIANGRCQLRT
tara:strand:+ start:471 stop:659 length:189 start_codon:yes stop_codon:yes gene_type:complete